MTTVIGGPIYEGGKWYVYVVFDPNTENEVVYRFSIAAARELGGKLSEWAADAGSEAALEGPDSEDLN